MTTYLQEDLAEAHKLAWYALNSVTLDGKDAALIMLLEVLDQAMAQTVMSEQYSSVCRSPVQ